MIAATTPTSRAVTPMFNPSQTSTPIPQIANPTTMPISSVTRFHGYRGGVATNCVTSSSLSGGYPPHRPADRLLHQRPGQPGGQEEVRRDGTDLGHHHPAGEPDPGPVHIGGQPYRGQGELPGPDRLATRRAGHAPQEHPTRQP